MRCVPLLEYETGISNICEGLVEQGVEAAFSSDNRGGGGVAASVRGLRGAALILAASVPKMTVQG